MHGGKADGAAGAKGNAASRTPTASRRASLDLHPFRTAETRRPNWNEITRAKVLVTTC